jgi:hypothetical protein
MKKLILSLLGIAAISSIGFAGTETYSGKEMKQVAAPPPCPEFYADQEFNVSLWGTYGFTGTEWRNDRYFLADHGWGGGMDFKYFFHRYFGVGIEGWVVDAKQERENIFADFGGGPGEDGPVFERHFSHDHKAIGSVLGTFTLRYPFHCSRFSPYIFGGGGAIFGGGQRPQNELVAEDVGGELDHVVTTGHTDSRTLAIGQVGGGLEIRFTPHIGWINDFSWNFIDGPNNNFGMVRSGVNFAF